MSGGLGATGLARYGILCTCCTAVLASSGIADAQALLMPREAGRQVWCSAMREMLLNSVTSSFLPVAYSPPPPLCPPFPPGSHPPAGHCDPHPRSDPRDAAHAPQHCSPAQAPAQHHLLLCRQDQGQGGLGAGGVPGTALRWWSLTAVLWVC
jgi:hypothetical protein